MIQFLCDHCHSPLQIGDDSAGKLDRCPFCGTNSRVPGNPKRTSKLTIIARMVALPLAVLLFWVPFLAIGGIALPFVIGGLTAVGGGIFFCWAFTNLVMLVWCPREYLLWKRGGGDPFFESLNWPLNTDPLEVRYQELFREKARQGLEQANRQYGIRQPDTPDSLKSIDDPNILS